MTAQSISNTKQPADAVQVAQATDMDVATYESKTTKPAGSRRRSPIRSSAKATKRRHGSTTA